MFVDILLHDSTRDFGVELESSGHREIFEISSRAVKKTIGSHLKSNCCVTDCSCLNVNSIECEFNVQCL